jgi:hypothetical protein
MGVDPLPVPIQVLIEKPAIREELKLTEAQKRQLQEVSDGQRVQQEELRQRHRNDPDAFRIALDAQRAAVEALILEIPNAHQLARLDQIRLQVEGPLAFRRPEFLARLGLDTGQSKRIEVIVARGFEEMRATSGVSLGVNPGDGRLTPERYRALSESKEFLAEVERCRSATLKAKDATIKAIEAVLSDNQRVAYRAMLGEPFDLAKLRDSATTSAISSKEKATLREDK